MSTLFSHFLTNFNQISPLEHDFTEVLDTIALKPKTLYFYGKLPKNVPKNELKTIPKTTSKSTSGPAPKDAPKSPPTPTKLFRPKTVAIVGSRRNTRYGEEVAYQMAYRLAAKGVIIVSGLAYGIDSIAHKGALDAGGRTVAVLGTPIDQIYPRAHEKLARDIVAQDGAIISELAPGAEFHPKATFLKRNRLISGLSDAVVVVEAAMRSGTLNTAAHALEQGREVFAVPGNITNTYSQGCNKLLRQGATPYTSPDDILSLLFPEDYARPATQAPLFGDTPVEAAVLAALFSGLKDGDAIVAATHLPIAVFNQTITLLELKGQVRSLGANKWSLV